MLVFVKDLLALYKTCRLSRSAAGLSYYLLLALFPMIVCVSILTTQFRYNEDDLLAMIDTWLGMDLRDLIPFQWQNPDRLSATVIFVIALTLLLSASAGAFRCLFHTADDIFGAVSQNPLTESHPQRRLGGILGMLISYLFATLLFFSVYASIFVMILWQELIGLLATLPTPQFVIRLLSEARFLLLFLLFFSICYLLQLCIQPRTVSPVGTLPGALFTAVGMGAVTLYFSLFIRGSAQYSLIYGSLASLVLWLMWIFFCGNLVLLGVAVNCLYRKNTQHHYY